MHVQFMFGQSILSTCANCTHTHANCIHAGRHQTIHSNTAITEQMNEKNTTIREEEKTETVCCNTETLPCSQNMLTTQEAHLSVNTLADTCHTLTAITLWVKLK